jgi:hypothetical protein
VSTPATVSAGESIQIQTSRLTNGTTQTSFTLERHNNDIGTFMSFKGMTPSKLSMNIASGSLTTGSIDFMGKSALESVVTQMPGTETAATTYEIHSGVAGASNAVWLDGVPITGTYIKSVSIAFDNTLRNQGAIGTLGSVAIGSGTIKCDLTAQIYFADNDIFTKFRNNTNTSMVIATTDADGNGYMISVPKANISTVKSNAGSKDQDMMLDVTMTALEDNANATAALRKVIFIDRIGAAVS